MINRESIAQALFAKVAAAPGFATKSRTLRHWSDVSAEEQPAMFQAQRRQQITRQRGAPPVRRFMFDLYVYARTSDETPASTVLNNLLDAIEAAIQPDTLVTGRCTLGNLVHDACIDGEIETDEGTLGDQAVAIVPILVILDGH